MIATHRSQLYLKYVGVEHEGDESGEQNHAELGGEGGQHRVPGGHLALVLRVPVQRQEPVHLGPWVYILTSNVLDKVKQMLRYLLLASNNYLRKIKKNIYPNMRRFTQNSSMYLRSRIIFQYCKIICQI